MNLLLLQASEIGEDLTVQIVGRRAEHLHCVLRAQPGDLIRTGVQGYKLGTAKLLESTRKTATLQMVSLNQEPPEPLPVTAIVAMPRPQSFKKVIHFVASAGIKKLYMIGTARVERSYWTSSALDQKTIQREIGLGLEQGVDTVPPEIEFRQDFRAFVRSGELARLAEGRTALVAHPGNAVPCPHSVDGPVTIAIGPEGGFIPEEVEAFEDASFRTVELGSRILRVEFALTWVCGRIS